MSTWFRRARAYVEATGCSWYILSAEHGLVHPDTVIAPYEATLSRMSVAERRAWGERVVSQLDDLPLDGARVILLAGQRYREPLLAYLETRAHAVEVPMAGLRLGKQLQWLATRSGGGEGNGPSTPRGAQRKSAVEDGKTDRRAITARLLELDRQIGAADLVPTVEPEAGWLLRDDAYAFLLAACLNRGTKASTIWTIPYWLQQQFGQLDPYRVREMSDDELAAALAALPRRPRYMSAAVETIRELTRIVIDEYGGDARALWSGRSSAAFQESLQRIRGVGPGLASMTVQLLMRVFPDDLEKGGTDDLDIKPDVHTRRVLYRLGVAEEQRDTAAIRAARALYPEHPGKIDGALWYVGLTWCHAQKPRCGDCFVAEVCQQRGVGTSPREEPSRRVKESQSAGTGGKRSGSYEPLTRYLDSQDLGAHPVRLTFQDIEGIVRRPLPRSARQYRAWWSNGGHTHARAWLSAGYQVDSVDLSAGTVEFSRRDGDG